MERDTFNRIYKIFIGLVVLIVTAVTVGIFKRINEGVSILGSADENIRAILDFLPLIVLILGIIFIVKRRKRVERKATGKVSDFEFLPTFLLCFFFGWLGVHRFYVERYRSGFFMLISLGFFGFWWALDFVAILAGEFYDDDGNVIKYHRASEEVKNKKSSSASIATELKKLAELKEEGILSEAEFLEQKKKLLD